MITEYSTTGKGTTLAVEVEIQEKTPKDIEQDRNRVDIAAFILAMSSYLETYSEPSLVKTTSPKRCLSKDEHKRGELVIAPTWLKAISISKASGTDCVKVGDRFLKISSTSDGSAFYYVTRLGDIKNCNMVVKQVAIDVVVGTKTIQVKIPIFENNKKIVKGAPLVVHDPSIAEAEPTAAESSSSRGPSKRAFDSI